MKYGATVLPLGGVEFRVWAPKTQEAAVRLIGKSHEVFPMQRESEDFRVLLEDARPGDRYAFVLNQMRELPDPRSRYQPEGVHGPSEIVDPTSFIWTDSEWNGIPIEDYIFYELHVGTYTAEGTFEAVVEKLDHLKNLGVTAIELMPVAQFPGGRNWGYDGVDLFAPHSAYGGPLGLKTLVDAAHRAGLAVVLDVVYNHLGPEGNYLAEFAPFFTDHYRTPWGNAINFDGPGSDGVRQFFIDNARYWLAEYHIDALRLDAIHGIFDFSARHILAELRDAVHQLSQQVGRPLFLIAESDLNDVRVIQSHDKGGFAMDAQWHDEFHHALVAVLTGARQGYLAGFGKLRDVQKAILEGFVYDGCYSAYRQRHFGSSSKEEPGQKFVTFIQNHDQIANTFQGARLSSIVSLRQYKLAVVLLLCSPALPLLFMGEEFADTSPFFYFTSHGDPELARAVTQGRRNEFAAFASAAEIPDPQAPDTFGQSKLDWPLTDRKAHGEVFALYRELIALRKQWPCLRNCRKDLTQVTVDDRAGWLRMRRRDPDGSEALLLCNFSESRVTLTLDSCHDNARDWRLFLASSLPIAEPGVKTVTLEGHDVYLYLAT